MDLFGFFIGSFAIIVFFVVIPGIVALVAGILLGIAAAIPIIAIGAMTHLVPKDVSAQKHQPDQPRREPN